MHRRRHVLPSAERGCSALLLPRPLVRRLAVCRHLSRCGCARAKAQRWQGGQVHAEPAAGEDHLLRSVRQSQCCSETGAVVKRWARRKKEELVQDRSAGAEDRRNSPQEKEPGENGVLGLVDLPLSAFKWPQKGVSTGRVRTIQDHPG